MSEGERLAEALLRLYGDPQNGWFTPLTEALAGLTATQAAHVPVRGFNSVWGVVNHLRYWTEYQLLRLRDEPVDPEVLGGHEGWPPPPDGPDEEAWAQAREHLTGLMEEMATLVGALSDEALAAPYRGGETHTWQVVHGLLGHLCYHTAEVIGSRHLQGLWLERV